MNLNLYYHTMEIDFEVAHSMEFFIHYIQIL